ncbi:phosphate/phosphite/phosphonate ABC transporter substrate-binding protein [Ramlibacter sp. MMS24-I3-19]|uniref:phosphate/phosphite/phosphonate ABC transporter substrate-binding protein n=1 Tax=Ramlibacter sp. MMS24-I3-19 TaxID=3416606 RepID=UPI003D0147B5
MEDHFLRRRELLATAAATIAAGIPALARAEDKPLVVAINEGVTYGASSVPFAERFREVSDDLQKLLKRPVKFVSVGDYRQLSAGLAEHQYDIAWVHPAHHAIRAMTTQGYRLVALTKGYTEYRVSFLVPSGSTLKSLADLKTARVGAPDEDSITSVIARATLNEANGQLPAMSYVKYQDAVPFMVENGLAAAGVSASSAVVRTWKEKGGKVLASSRPVPIKQLIASPSLSAAQLADVRRYFSELDRTEAGKRRLEAFGVAGFEEFDQARVTGMGKWLGV